jgi:carboxypeptidase family protein
VSQVPTDPATPLTNPVNAWGQIEAGKFEVVGLAPGSYDVRVNVQGHGNKQVRAEAGGPELKVVVGVGAKITGKVVLEDGTAAASTWVTAAAENGGNEGAVTDVEGRYAISGLEAGTYRVEARSMGGGTQLHGTLESIAVRAGEAAEAPTITLHPQAPAPETPK